MSSRVKILGQSFVPYPDGGPDGKKIGLTRVSSTNGQKTTMVLPTLSPADAVNVYTNTAQLTLETGFYITAEGGLSADKLVSIEGQPSGTELLVISLHPAFGGFGSES